MPKPTKIKLKNHVDKKRLWTYVNIKINRVIHHYHVFSILNILVEELLEALMARKEIKIFNFGDLNLKKKERERFYITPPFDILIKLLHSFPCSLLTLQQPF